MNSKITCSECTNIMVILNDQLDSVESLKNRLSMTKPMGMSLWDCLDSLMHMGGISLLWVAPVSSERLLACLSGKVNPSTSKQASRLLCTY